MDVISPRRARRYDSPLRAQRAAETKAALVGAATDLFITKGWAASGMREVARAAGVAVETLYSHYPSKRALLDAVVDQAAAGDDAPLAVAERAEFQAMGRGRRADRIAAAAAVTAAVNVRTAPIAQIIRDAAGADPEIAAVLRATRERQRADVAVGVGLVLGRTPTDAERDGVWALASPEVFQLLVHESGWSVDDYERWVADTLARTLPRT
jgi:AcrR family transcriptional regulator